MSYLEELERYVEAVRGAGGTQVDRRRLEHHFECLRDRNKLHSLDAVKTWFEGQRAACLMEVEDIPLTACRQWNVDPLTGDLSHASGEFFRVHGIRVRLDSREVGEGGWDQPMMTQVGYDGGILGIIRQRHEGVPHYLVEAKAEPGNYGTLQLSPTLQATFSNLNRAHAGRKPRFANYFETPEKMGAQIHYDQWMSEDGGRLHLKRNRGMLVEVAEGTVTDLPSGFIWVSMFQLKALLHENAWINPHIRGIIAHL